MGFLDSLVSMKGETMMTRISLLAATILLFAGPLAYGGEPKISKPFTLDALRYIKTLHKGVNVPVFGNNGVRGIGLTLSFIGKLDSKVLDAYNLNVHKVILADGSGLPSSSIRTKSSGSTSYKDGWGIVLGSDQQSVGIQIDLNVEELINFQSISGSFQVSQATGSHMVQSGLLEDKKNSKDNKLGIEIEICTNWGSEGRYYLLKVPNVTKIQDVKVLNEKGEELEQTIPFDVIFNNGLKIYVKKSKGNKFRMQLNMAKETKEVKVPFSIGQVKIDVD